MWVQGVGSVDDRLSWPVGTRVRVMNMRGTSGIGSIGHTTSAPYLPPDTTKEDVEDWLIDIEWESDTTGRSATTNGASLYVLEEWPVIVVPTDLDALDNWLEA